MNSLNKIINTAAKVALEDGYEQSIKSTIIADPKKFKSKFLQQPGMGKQAWNDLLTYFKLEEKLVVVDIDTGK